MRTCQLGTLMDLPAILVGLLPVCPLMNSLPQARYELWVGDTILHRCSLLSLQKWQGMATKALPKHHVILECGPKRTFDL